MQKLLILFIITLSLAKGAFSQNVGVGTTTPSQKLDVAGNISTTGNLMVNGVAGTNGQVLTMNGSTMQWMDKSRFKNWSLYTSSATFTVPAGVTEVMIEMWGGGGGGHSPGGGGGSGGYWIGLITLNTITTINLTVGAGGTAGANSTAGGQGGNTGFNCTGFNVFTEGGFGADSSLSGTFETYSGGRGGIGLFPTGLVIPPGFRNHYFLTGNHGSPTYIDFVQISSTAFTKKFIGGVGGIAHFSGQTSRPQQVRIIDPSGIDYDSPSGGLVDFSMGGHTSPFSSSTPGGPGRIIIYY